MEVWCGDQTLLFWKKGVFLTKLVKGGSWFLLTPIFGLIFHILCSLFDFLFLEPKGGIPEVTWGEASISRAVLTQVLLFLFFPLPGQDRDRATRLMEWGSGLSCLWEHRIFGTPISVSLLSPSILTLPHSLLHIIVHFAIQAVELKPYTLKYTGGNEYAHFKKFWGLISDLLCLLCFDALTVFYFFSLFCFLFIFLSWSFLFNLVSSLIHINSCSKNP